MKKYNILLIVMTLFVLSSCAVIYPSLPNAYIEGIPSKKVEVYCYKEKEQWLCAARVNTSEDQNYEEVRHLEFVSLLDMKKILANKGLSECFFITIVDLSSDKVKNLDIEEYQQDYQFLMKQLKY